MSDAKSIVWKQCHYSVFHTSSVHEKEGTTIPGLGQLLQNGVLAAAIIAWAAAQSAKAILWTLRNQRFDLKYFSETGGMPSAHSAFVASLGTAVAVKEGLDSPLFALALVLAAIVMFDAAGVRRAAGKQAQVLNAILEDLNRMELHPEKLKELLGHTPFEVIIGAVLGIVVALLWLG